MELEDKKQKEEVNLKKYPFGLPPGTIRDITVIIFSFTLCLISFIVIVFQKERVELIDNLYSLFSTSIGVVLGYYFGSRKP